MRTVSIIIAITLISVAAIAGEKSKEPKELIALKKQHEANIAAALAPIIVRYKESLKLLKERLTKSGDLESALAVKNEISRLEEEASRRLPQNKKTKELESDPDCECAVRLEIPDINGREVSVNGGISKMGKNCRMPKWYWGDGKTSESFFPATHKYMKSGEYNIQVTGTDSKNRRTVSSVDIKIE